MPQGKGTYGTRRGRPSKKKKSGPTKTIPPMRKRRQWPKKNRLANMRGY